MRISENARQDYQLPSAALHDSLRREKLSIRMEDLARLIDDTRINVSNVLNDLQNRGLIQLGRRTFSIPELREVVQLLDKKD